MFCRNIRLLSIKSFHVKDFLLLIVSTFVSLLQEVLNSNILVVTILNINMVGHNTQLVFTLCSCLIKYFRTINLKIKSVAVALH